MSESDSGVTRRGPESVGPAGLPLSQEGQKGVKQDIGVPGFGGKTVSESPKGAPVIHKLVPQNEPASISQETHHAIAPQTQVAAAKPSPPPVDLSEQLYEIDYGELGESEAEELLQNAYPGQWILRSEAGVRYKSIKGEDRTIEDEHIITYKHLPVRTPDDEKNLLSDMKYCLKKEISDEDLKKIESYLKNEGRDAFADTYSTQGYEVTKIERRGKEYEIYYGSESATWKEMSLPPFSHVEICEFLGPPTKMDELLSQIEENDIGHGFISSGDAEELLENARPGQWVLRESSSSGGVKRLCQSIKQEDGSLEHVAVWTPEDAGKILSDMKNCVKPVKE
jgi:hypothetical protein